MLQSRKIPSCLLVVSALLVGRVAFADTDAPKPCAADLKKVCPKVKAGHGAVLACLEQNSDKVSQKCQDSLTEKAQALESACKPDLDQFCAQVEHGGGRLLQCLAKHEAELSDGCKAFWGKAKSKAKAAAK